MKTKNDYLSIKRKHSQVVDLCNKSPDVKRQKGFQSRVDNAEKEFDSTVDEVETEAKSLEQRMERMEETFKLYQEQHNKDITELKDKMTTITNILNCRLSINGL